VVLAFFVFKQTAHWYLLLYMDEEEAAGDSSYEL
jgi:hypothetical protein